MSGMTRNTSQDPEYEGLPYHEKKFHKTHFAATNLKLKGTKPSKYEWVKVGVGRYIRVPKVRHARKTGKKLVQVP